MLSSFTNVPFLSGGDGNQIRNVTIEQGLMGEVSAQQLERNKIETAFEMF